MKTKLFKDLLVYVLFPVLLFIIGKTGNLYMITQIVGFSILIYTAYTKYNQRRINTSALLFCISFMTFMLVKSSVRIQEVYTYNTCLLLSIVVLIPLFRVIDKDIGIVILKDILVALDKNSLSIMKLFKKKQMVEGIKKISSITELSLGLVVLLRMINIIAFNGISESYLNFLSRLICMICIGVVIYRISKLSYISKEIKDIKSTNKNNEIHRKGKVINLNNFK